MVNYRNTASARREAIVKAMLAVSNPPPQVNTPDQETNEPQEPQKLPPRRRLR
jgi:hypothetical protein